MIASVLIRMTDIKYGRNVRANQNIINNKNTNQIKLIVIKQTTNKQIRFFFSPKISPILLMADYRYEEYYDGSWVPVCLTQASNVWNITFFVMTISAFFLLPLLILIVLYTIIAKNLIAKDGRMVKIRPSKPELSFKARKQVVLMLGAVVLSFFLCLIPFRIFTLWIIIVPDEMVKKFGLENYYNCLYFSRIMLYLNSAINPILYNLMSSKFRKGFRKLCCGRLWFHVERCEHFERGAAPVQHTNNTNTTTTTSIGSQNMCKRLSNSRTISQDDVKHGSITSSHPSETWHRCSTPIDSADNFRRIVLKNTRYKRQRSSQSMTTSGDEENADADMALCSTCAKCAVTKQKGQITFSTSCDSSAECSAVRKNGFAGPKHHHPRKKKLKFQHCFDEDKTIQLNDVTADAVDARMVSEANRKAEYVKEDEVEPDQHIVPFLS